MIWVKKERRTGAIRFRFVVENIGNTPALGVELYAGLRQSNAYLANQATILQQAAEFAQRVQRGHEDAYTITLFPGETTVRQWICPIPDTDLIGDQDTANENWYQNIIIVPVLIACVDYRLAFAEQHQQTWEVYTIRRKTSGKKSGVTNAMVPVDGDIPIDELDMDRTPLGGTFTN